MHKLTLMHICICLQYFKESPYCHKALLALWVLFKYLYIEYLLVMFIVSNENKSLVGLHCFISHRLILLISQLVVENYNNEK